MKIYIAAPFFTPEQLAIVKKVECFLESNSIDYFSPRSGGELKKMSKEDQAKTKKKIFDDNIKNMDYCTHMIACVEYRDTGTNFEIGYYYAKEKPIVLFSEKIGTVNVMLAESAISVCDDENRIYESLLGIYNAEIGDYT